MVKCLYPQDVVIKNSYFDVLAALEECEYIEIDDLLLLLAVPATRLDVKDGEKYKRLMCWVHSKARTSNVLKYDKAGVIHKVTEWISELDPATKLAYASEYRLVAGIEDGFVVFDEKTLQQYRSIRQNPINSIINYDVVRTTSKSGGLVQMPNNGQITEYREKVDEHGHHYCNLTLTQEEWLFVIKDASILAKRALEMMLRQPDNEVNLYEVEHVYHWAQSSFWSVLTAIGRRAYRMINNFVVYNREGKITYISVPFSFCDSKEYSWGYRAKPELIAAAQELFSKEGHPEL